MGDTSKRPRCVLQGQIRSRPTRTHRRSRGLASLPFSHGNGLVFPRTCARHCGATGQSGASNEDAAWDWSVVNLTPGLHSKSSCEPDIDTCGGIDYVPAYPPVGWLGSEPTGIAIGSHGPPRWVGSLMWSGPRRQDAPAPIRLGGFDAPGALTAHGWRGCEPEILARPTRFLFGGSAGRTIGMESERLASL